MYVLDARMRPVPANVVGDLYIGGVQVAREYLGRPDLTAERFLPSPFTSGRIYETGDLARWRADGALIFLGRSDHQVKIRGQRIELGDIEAHLSAHPTVARAAVIVREDRPGDQRLVAYVVARTDASDNVSAWRAHLADRLPDYMVPSAFVTLPALPLSHNGKLNRALLPVPGIAATKDTARPLATAAERRVATLMIEILGLADETPLGADDDFFTLGGHSLLAARLAQRLREAFGVDVSLGTVFAHPTPARLARVLASDSSSDSTVTKPFRPKAHGLDPLITIVSSAAEETPALFCIHPAGGISWCYGHLARAMAPARNVHGLQARGLDPRVDMPTTLDEMAADYVDQIRRVQPHGPYHLVGWSVGGIVAHAMATRIQDVGDRVGVVAMLDAYPADRWRDEADPDERAALKALLYIAGQNPETVETAELTRETVMASLRRHGHPLASLSDDALTGVIRVVERNSLLVRRHRHRRYHRTVLHFRATLEPHDQPVSPDEWRPYVDDIETYEIPALHAHLTGADAIARIAPVVDRHLAAASRGAEAPDVHSRTKKKGRR